MGMSSWEEDELFKSYGWEKDLIQRIYIGPKGHIINFDTVMDAGDSPEGEQALVETVRAYGVRQRSA